MRGCTPQVLKYFIPTYKLNLRWSVGSKLEVDGCLDRHSQTKKEKYKKEKYIKELEVEIKIPLTETKLHLYSNGLKGSEWTVD